MDNRKTVSVAAILCAAVVSCGEERGAPSLTSGAALRSTSSSERGPTLTPQTSGFTDRRVFGISPVDDEVVWASASGGTWLRTTNGGATWESGTVAGAETLQFRDVQGGSAEVAYLMSVPNTAGSEARIYKTLDAGSHWTLQFSSPDANGFFDCIAFWDSRHGILMADSQDGKFPLARTLDGTHWEDLRTRAPAALPGESAFAASGTCAATQGERRGWMVTGAIEASVMPDAKARVLATSDRGNTWTAYETPFAGSGLGGLTTIAFRDARHGITAGGPNIVIPETASNNVGRSSDGGKTWHFTAHRTSFPGAVYGLAYVSGDHGDQEGEDDGGFARAVVATGPFGAAYSFDEGDSWTTLEGVTGFWAVAFASPEAGWMVGSKGRILKISF